MYLGRRRGARMEGVLIAQRTDGSGVELLRATSWFMQEFNTAEWPIPRDSRNPDGSKKIGQYGFPGRGHGRTAGRVVYTPPPDWDGKNLPRARFSWGRVVPSETWYVLAELLRVSYGQIFFLGNINGNGKKTIGLSGSSLVYMPGSHLHSVFSRFDLFPEPPPKHFLLGGCEIDDPMLPLCAD